MVFGFFSRKQSVPTQPSQFQQLRTPSPSVDSTSVGKASPQHPTAFSHPQSPFPLPPTSVTPSPPPPALITDPTPLHSLLLTIPPKTLHAYTLANLLPPSHSSPPSPSTLTTLTSFFSSLTPPPRLHCVRCHKHFFDIDNTDRSCLVPHDDDSAEVERVRAQYETLWGCCGRTVEGDGDMGPPDGWCYEGKHTTDPKRARFRADSTPHDDKLTSCERLRCHEPPRGRKRMRLGEDVNEEEASEDDSGLSVKGSVRGKRRTAKKARKYTDEGEEEQSREMMDIDDADTTSITSSKRKSKPKSKAKPSTTAKSKPATPNPSPTTSTLAKPAPASVKPRSTAPTTKPKPPSAIPSKPSTGALSAKPHSRTSTRNRNPKACEGSASPSPSPKPRSRVAFSTAHATREVPERTIITYGRRGSRAGGVPLGEVVDSSVGGEEELRVGGGW